MREIKTADIYTGTANLSSFLTPDMLVKTVDPVNCRAIYELANGKNYHEKTAAGAAMEIFFIPRKVKTSPAIQPLTANDRNGTNGSRSGVTNAPDRTAKNPTGIRGQVYFLAITKDIDIIAFSEISSTLLHYPRIRRKARLR